MRHSGENLLNRRIAHGINIPFALDRQAEPASHGYDIHTLIAGFSPRGDDKAEVSEDVSDVPFEFVRVEPTRIDGQKLIEPAVRFRVCRGCTAIDRK